MGKRNKLFQTLLFIAIIFLHQGCKDVFSNDITRGRLNIVSPSDSFVTNNSNVPFIWDALDGAETYHLQIVQPSFDSIQQLIADTMIVDTKYIFSFLPGKYQWRIRAENSGSTTTYIVRNIVVDTNSNLSGQQFNVSGPADNYVISSSVINFSWLSFPSANVYEYILLDTNNNTLQDKTTIQIIFTDTLAEGIYLWKARALNTINNTSTLFSTPRHITVDLTPPVPSIPNTPANNSLDTNAVTLTWTRPSDVYADSIIVATDLLFQNVTNSASVTSASYYVLPFLVLNQPYFWRIRSRDIAGNWSTYSTIYKFTVTH